MDITPELLAGANSISRTQRRLSNILTSLHSIMLRVYPSNQVRQQTLAQEPSAPPELYSYNTYPPPLQGSMAQPKQPLHVEEELEIPSEPPVAEALHSPPAMTRTLSPSACTDESGVATPPTNRGLPPKCNRGRPSSNCENYE